MQKMWQSAKYAAIAYLHFSDIPNLPVTLTLPLSILLWSLVVNYFWSGCFAPPSMLCPGATAPPSYAIDSRIFWLTTTLVFIGA